MANVGVFTHHPLDLGAQHVRLVKVVTIGTYQKPKTPPIINLELAHVDLQKLPRYSALSYTWGPPEPTKEIRINNQSFLVRENRWHFLDVAATKYDIRANWIWIDQLCIDQNNTNERNHQVAMMGRIYEHATQVIAWLGVSNL